MARIGVDAAAATAGEWELSEEESSCGHAEPRKGQESSGSHREWKTADKEKEQKHIGPRKKMGIKYPLTVV